MLDLDGLIGGETTRNDAQEEQPAPETGDNEEEEQEFEFRLFSAPTKPKETTAKAQESSKDTKTKENTDNKKQGSGGTQKLRIRLRSPTPVPGEGRLVKAFRGWEYYFSTPSLLGQPESGDQLAEKTRQFEDMAVTGQQVIASSKSPWVSYSQSWVLSLHCLETNNYKPGCDLPWRVIHLKRHQTKLPPKSQQLPVYVVEGAPPAKSPKTRKKPGKKRRLQLRKRVATAQAAQETEAEKRNRKNRERKIKRRQKAREEKAAAAAAGGGDVAMADVDGSSSAGDE